MIVDQGRIGSKIFYSNQTHKQIITSCLQHRGDARKSKASSLAFLIVDEGLQSSLMMTSFALLAFEPFDHASKEFWESTSK
jgi:uncharacterized membrane protein YbaN (DUF454 family)